jgi:hypothetical protein
MKTQVELLSNAFSRFVQLIGSVPDVCYVTATEPRRPDIHTYIKRWDQDVMHQVFLAENKVADEFPELLIDFHVWFLDGRRIHDFVNPLPELFYQNPSVKTQASKSGNAG